jgi:hypothetical protein
LRPIRNWGMSQYLCSLWSLFRQECLRSTPNPKGLPAMVSYSQNEVFMPAVIVLLIPEQSRPWWMLSPDMAKLSSEKVVREANHRWHSPLCSKEDVTRPVVGETFFIPFCSCFTSFYLNLFSGPNTPRIAPTTPDTFLTFTFWSCRPRHKIVVSLNSY